MKVLVTGGAGFLGRGLLRRQARGDLDWEITVYSRDEQKQDVCRQRYPTAHYVLGDVGSEQLKIAMAGHDAVVHAAAMKYIPEAEVNASECIRVNVNGTQNVIEAARWAGVERVVGISTDKAVQPVNVYGASKMVMERLFAEASGTIWGGRDLTFTCVRYGNVIGSTGSVIPLFQRQLREGGKVKLTNPKMTRYWMSVEEAIDLIIAAMTAAPGTIVVPEPRAMHIEDVAKAATSDDVPIEIIGVRPGEKEHEQLMHFEESVRSRRHNGHYELLPPGTSGASAAFTLASHTPDHWMTIEEMRELIGDAATV